jgi:hypothetical protein
MQSKENGKRAKSSINPFPPPPFQAAFAGHKERFVILVIRQLNESRGKEISGTTYA